MPNISGTFSSHTPAVQALVQSVTEMDVLEEVQHGDIVERHGERQQRAGRVNPHWHHVPVGRNHGIEPVLDIIAMLERRCLAQEAAVIGRHAAL